MPLPSPEDGAPTRIASSPATALVWAELTVISAWIEWLYTRQRAEAPRLGCNEHSELQREIDNALAERERIVERLCNNVPLAIGND